jgi:hypothetical protein
MSDVVDDSKGRRKLRLAGEETHLDKSVLR